MGSSGISMRMNREKEEETDVWGGEGGQESYELGMWWPKEDSKRSYRISSKYLAHLIIRHSHLK